MLIQDKNNFDAVRLSLAITVVFSHVLVLTQLPTFSNFYLFNADFAVKGFFAISGFLVMKSYSSSASLFEFFEKRIRRIYPAYFTTIIICFLLGVSYTTLDLYEFLKHPDSIRYVISNLTFLNFIQPSLPSVFDGNPYKIIDGSLWTIKIEICLYLCIPIIFFSFRRWGAIRAAGLIFILSSAWVLFFKHFLGTTLGAEVARQFPGQLSYFIFGALLSFNEKVFALLGYILILSFALFLIFENTFLNVLLEPSFYSSLVIYLATKAIKNLHLGKFGDLSYGVYLIHFPIIQSLIHLKVFSYNPWLGLILTIALTLCLAWLSWHLIEKRFLKRSSYYVLTERGNDTNP